MPIVVGGTNLYLKALLEGMFEGPPADEAFRAACAEAPAGELHQRLSVIDPEAALRIDANDHKRLVRALEVHHLTGRPISQLQRQWSEAHDKTYRHDPIMIGLQWSTPTINGRINARVKEMFTPPEASEDLIAETQRLLDANMLGEQARQAIGTKQVLDHLAGRCTRDEAVERVKIDTRRFAKAQRTWLKRYRGVTWFEPETMPWDDVVAAAIGLVSR
jgi:tRNA dimethylallyltransferase